MKIHTCTYSLSGDRAIETEQHIRAMKDSGYPQSDAGRLARNHKAIQKMSFLWTST